MNKIFWVDMEMTGLEVDQCVIIEFAAIVTDMDMKPIDEYHAVVFQPPEELAKMDDWNQNTHSNSGLLAKIPYGLPLETVETQVLEMLHRHFSEDDRPVLAGNSIQQDRKFIDKYMLRLADFLHYRMLDVSSFKIIFQNMYGLAFKKSETHRAVDDINESIAELQYYLGYVKVPEETH